MFGFWVVFIGLLTLVGLLEWSASVWRDRRRRRDQRQEEALTRYCQKYRCKAERQK